LDEIVVQSGRRYILSRSQGKGFEAMKTRIRTRKRIFMSVAALAAVMMVAASGSVHAALQEGGGGQDVIFGADDDNAGNTVVQPADVAAKQHLDNTDLILGGSRADLLVGLAGDDVIDGEGIRHSDRRPGGRTRPAQQRRTARR
jgi:Ca2+-binding RTX toxin-like protein